MFGTGRPGHRTQAGPRRRGGSRPSVPSPVLVLVGYPSGGTGRARWASDRCSPLRSQQGAMALSAVPACVAHQLPAGGSVVAGRDRASLAATDSDPGGLQVAHGPRSGLPSTPERSRLSVWPRALGLAGGGRRRGAQSHAERRSPGASRTGDVPWRAALASGSAVKPPPCRSGATAVPAGRCLSLRTARSEPGAARNAPAAARAGLCPRSLTSSAARVWASGLFARPDLT